MPKEIGSNFWIMPRENLDSTIDDSIFRYTFDDKVFTASGRNAITLVLRDLNSKKRALLPSFTCESIIEAFIKSGCEVFFYYIEDNLSVNADRFLNEVNSIKPDIIFFQNYFGFNTLKEIEAFTDQFKEIGIVVVEDTTQCLYSSFERIQSDYQVGSFRKWADIPVGGYALKNTGYFSQKPNKINAELVAEKIIAMMMKYDYMVNNKGSKEVYLKQYARAEEILEKQEEIYSMGTISVLMQATINYQQLIEKRRENYIMLLNRLQELFVTPVFTTLPDDVVPLYFPVYCHGKRKEIQKMLKDNNIFAPIVWPESKYASTSNNNNTLIYNDLLSIPCDQRYDKEDIDRIYAVIKSISM